MNQQWKQVKGIFNEASKNMPGYAEGKKEKKMDTWKDIEERRRLN